MNQEEKGTVLEPMRALAERLIESAIDSDASGRPDGALYQLAMELRTALAAQQRAETPPEPTRWRPIETAPKDGTRVLVSWDGGDHGDKSVHLSFWLDNSKTSVPWSGWRVPSMEPRPLGKATHWMPMPSPCLATPPERAETPEPKIVCWWNGFAEEDEHDHLTGPSYSQKEDTWHDIPLVAISNPCNGRAETPQASPEPTDWLIDLQCACHKNEGEDGDEALRRVRDLVTHRIGSQAKGAAQPDPSVHSAERDGEAVQRPSGKD